MILQIIWYFIVFFWVVVVKKNLPYVIPLPPKVQGSLGRRRMKDCESPQQWTTTSNQCFLTPNAAGSWVLGDDRSRDCMDKTPKIKADRSQHGGGEEVLRLHS